MFPVWQKLAAAIIMIMIAAGPVSAGDEVSDPVLPGKALNGIEERVKKLEAKRMPKMISPTAEINFLFEDVFGRQYIYLDHKDKKDREEPVVLDNRAIRRITITRGWFGEDTTIEFFPDRPTTALVNAELSIGARGGCLQSTDVLSMLTGTVHVYSDKLADVRLNGTLSSKVTSTSSGTVVSRLTGTVMLKTAALPSQVLNVHGQMKAQVAALCNAGVVSIDPGLTVSLDLESAAQAQFSMKAELVSRAAATVEGPVLLSQLTGTVSVALAVVTYHTRYISGLPLMAKLEAVERTVGVPEDKDADIVERISRVHAKLNNGDWQTDNIRFGIAPLFLKRVDAMATSLALHAYPAYRRFTPVQEFPWDFGRRLSIFLAVGEGSGESAGASISGPVYTVGLGVDIVKGVAINAGYSVFNYKPDDVADLEHKRSVTLGFTLNSDLWRELFNMGK